jgi:hypothetical protein
MDRPLADGDRLDLERALASARAGATVVLDQDGPRYRVDNVAPDATLIGALAGWCATADRLIVELRTGGSSLEETYLELVGRPHEGGS